MLCRIPCLDSSRVNCFQVYWLPRSEWKIGPRFGRRWLIAIRSASQTRSARMWSAIAQPTTRASGVVFECLAGHRGDPALAARSAA